MLIIAVIKLSNYLWAVILHLGLRGRANSLCLWTRIQTFAAELHPVWVWTVEMRGGPAAINSLRLCCFSSHSSDLRVFPERYVVCVSRPEDASTHHGNLSLATVSAVYTLPFPLGEQPRVDLCVIIGTRCQIAFSLCASWSVFRLRDWACRTFRVVCSAWGGFVGGVSWGPIPPSHLLPQKSSHSHTPTLALQLWAVVQLKHGVVVNLNTNG